MDQTAKIMSETYICYLQLFSVQGNVSEVVFQTGFDVRMIVMLKSFYSNESDYFHYIVISACRRGRGHE